MSRSILPSFLLFIIIILTACGSDSGSSGNSMPSDAKVIYLHHSTGGVIWGGGVEAGITAYNSSHSKSYSIEDLAYPNSPYPWKNYPYDYWYLWVDGGGQAASESVPTLESFTEDYDVIVFKHCYPVSGISADTGSPVITSETKSIENYKLQYNALKTRLRQFPDNRFIVWTGAALIEAASSAAEGARARTFFTWVKNEWDEPGDNIFVWDFFELETEGGNFLKTDYSSGDSHPNGSFATAVAPYFVNRLVDVIEGRGDTGSLTGN